MPKSTHPPRTSTHATRPRYMLLLPARVSYCIIFLLKTVKYHFVRSVLTLSFRWFPGDGYKQITKPWETFTDLLKEIVILQECAMGYTHKQNPDRKPWNLEFHDSHPRW